MNHFILHKNLRKSAEQHCDKHCIKIILEACQIASTTRSVLGIWSPYKPTHINHPISKWCRISLSNYIWMCKYGLALCKEYTYRYGKTHKCEQYFIKMLSDLPNLPKLGLTQFCQCMPEEYKTSNTINAYRNYYRFDKLKNIDCRWTKRKVPSWIEVND